LKGKTEDERDFKIFRQAKWRLFGPFTHINPTRSISQRDSFPEKRKEKTLIRMDGIVSVEQ
jgi:hypothetical protein